MQGPPDVPPATVGNRSSDDQLGTGASAQSASEVHNVLIESLCEAAPEAAAAASAALRLLKTSKQQQEMQAVQQSFLEEYHWHSGSPLAPAIWTATEQTAILLSKFQTPSELLGCPMLRNRYKNRILKALQQCKDRQLVANKAEADRHLAEVCREAKETLKDFTSRQEAMNSRALHLYASSLSNNSFINRTSNIVLQSTGKQQHSSKGGKKAAAAAGKGGADRIKEANRLRQVAKQQMIVYRSSVQSQPFAFCSMMKRKQQACHGMHSPLLGLLSQMAAVSVYVPAPSRLNAVMLLWQLRSLWLPMHAVPCRVLL